MNIQRWGSFSVRRYTASCCRTSVRWHSVDRKSVWSSSGRWCRARWPSNRWTRSPSGRTCRSASARRRPSGRTAGAPTGRRCPTDWSDKIPRSWHLWRRMTCRMIVTCLTVVTHRAHLTIVTLFSLKTVMKKIRSVFQVFHLLRNVTVV